MIRTPSQPRGAIVKARGAQVFGTSIGPGDAAVSHPLYRAGLGWPGADGVNP